MALPPPIHDFATKPFALVSRQLGFCNLEDQAVFKKIIKMNCYLLVYFMTFEERRNIAHVPFNHLTYGR